MSSETSYHGETQVITAEDRDRCKEYRCPYCHKLFFLGRLDSALIEIKCRCCKKVTKINI